MYVNLNNKKQFEHIQSFGLALIGIIIRIMSTEVIHYRTLVNKKLMSLLQW